MTDWKHALSRPALVAALLVGIAGLHPLRHTTHPAAARPDPAIPHLRSGDLYRLEAV